MTDPTREALVFRSFPWKGPKYFDKPDGQDLIGKLSSMTKVGFFAGAVCGIIKAQQEHPHSLTLRLTLQKASQVILPFVAAPIAFTVVTYTATNLRKKDDQINYMLGGATAGFVGANLARLPQYTAFAVISLTAICYFHKTIMMIGQPLNPPLPTKRVRSPYFEKEWSFSFIKDRPANWTREPPTA